MENNKIYSFKVVQEVEENGKKRYFKTFNLAEIYLKNGKKVEKKYPNYDRADYPSDEIYQATLEGAKYIDTDEIAKNKENIDFIEVIQKDCYGYKKRYKSEYPDFIDDDMGIVISQKALNFLDKYNINYWKLEKPVKIVNDKDVKEKYYLIEFTDEHDVLDRDASEIYLDKEKQKYRYYNEDKIDWVTFENLPETYFRDDKVNIDGIYKVKYKGKSFIVCNSKTKTLLEESGLTGFEFEEQLLASQKPKEKTFVDKLLGK